MGEVLLCRFTCVPTTDQERGNKNGTGNDHWLTLNVSLLRLDSSQAEFSGSSYTVLSAAEILPHPKKKKKRKMLGRLPHCVAAPRKPSLNVRNKAVLLLLVIIPDRREQEPQPNQSQEMYAHHFRSEELRISC